MTAAPARATLPAWRLAAALFILGGMAIVLISLAPVYWEDHELTRYLREVAARPDVAMQTDDSLQKNLAARARDLGLPLQPRDVKVSRADGKLQMEMRYAVHFHLYQVDLHFHAAATH